MRVPIRVVLILAIIVLLGVLFVGLLPRGYDTDLTRVGNGQPAAVLVHDPQYVASVELMEQLNRVRGDFEPPLQFLVADVNVPLGQRFAEAHGAQFATLLLFDATGRRVGAYGNTASTEELRRWLSQVQR
jgi:hypothetical protein